MVGQTAQLGSWYAGAGSFHVPCRVPCRNSRHSPRGDVTTVAGAATCGLHLPQLQHRDIFFRPLSRSCTSKLTPIPSPNVPI